VIEWPYVPIEEVSLRVAMGPFGSSIKVSTFVSSGIPVISGQHLRGSRLYDFDYNFVTEAHADQLAKANVQRGDVILTHAGNIGQVAYIPQSSQYERYVISQRQFYVRCDPSRLIPEFLVYYFESHEGRHRLLANANQTGVPSLSQPVTYIRKVEIPLPSLAEQRAIAGVLGALDDKIESNLRTWRLSTELVRSEYELLVSEESGSSCRLRDICDFNLRTRKPGSPGEAIRYIDISSVEAGVVTGESETTWADAPSRARRSVTDGDLIFSTVRPARMAYSMMIDPASSTVVSTGFAVMSPKGVPSALLFAIVSDAEFGKYCESVSQGSAYPAVSPDSMGNYEVQLPEKDVLSTFGVRTEAILRRAHQGMQENRALASMRDALLPELLSGRLRVKDAELMMENV
jgi:type I restriction enzyme S subunit